MAFSRRHYRLVSPPADTAADIAARQHRTAALQQAHLDTLATFNAITAENVREVLRFQEQRIRELIHAGGSR